MFATGPFNLQGCSVEVYMAMGDNQSRRADVTDRVR